MWWRVQSVHVQSQGGLKERSIRQLSGGERRRVALALALGFADLTAGRGQLRCNLIVLDEVTPSLLTHSAPSQSWNPLCWVRSTLLVWQDRHDAMHCSTVGSSSMGSVNSGSSDCCTDTCV